MAAKKALKKTAKEKKVLPTPRVKAAPIGPTVPVEARRAKQIAEEFHNLLEDTQSLQKQLLDVINEDARGCALCNRDYDIMSAVSSLSTIMSTFVASRNSLEEIAQEAGLTTERFSFELALQDDEDTEEDPEGYDPDAF